MKMDDLDALSATGQYCIVPDGLSAVNVNEKWHTLLNWGFIFNLIMSIIYGIGVTGAALGMIAPALGSLCCHAFGSCVQFAFFITMAVWRYNSWGSYCSDYSSLAPIGNSIQNIFISLCVFNVLSCFTNRSAQQGQAAWDFRIKRNYACKQATALCFVYIRKTVLLPIYFCSYTKSLIRI